MTDREALLALIELIRSGTNAGTIKGLMLRRKLDALKEKLTP